MHSIIHAGMEVLETLFLVGWAGSLVVVVISGIEDVITVLKKDEKEPAAAIAGDHQF